MCQERYDASVGEALAAAAAIATDKAKAWAAEAQTAARLVYEDLPPRDDVSARLHSAAEEMRRVAHGAPDALSAARSYVRAEVEDCLAAWREAYSSTAVDFDESASEIDEITVIQSGGGSRRAG